MITILHGENIVQSREELTKIIDESRKNKSEIIRLEAKELNIPELEQALGNISLFASPQLIVIENLHSLPKSKKKDELISLISKSDINSGALNLVLWEKRALTPTMIKKISAKRELNFKLTNQLFKWLDSLSPDKRTKKNQLQLLRTALKDNGDHMCFLMLIRQIRLLIQAKDNGIIKGAPFMISKLKQQASAFKLSSLIDTHKHLLKIDLDQKTSKNKLDLAQELDLLIINL